MHRRGIQLARHVPGQRRLARARRADDAHEPHLPQARGAGARPRRKAGDRGYDVVQLRSSTARARAAASCSATRTGAVPPVADRDANDPLTESTERT